ncbi:Rab family GTPase [Pelomyxa schiedti]|nr:Rab family GTPase [Pelomyxa schiedti]
MAAAADPNVVEIMLIGEPNVGKTSLTRCFMLGRPSVVGGVAGGGVDTSGGGMPERDSEGFYSKPRKLGKRNVDIKVWDSAGEEKFAHITVSIFKKCKGCIVVYDVTDAESLRGAKGWYSQFVRFSEPSASEGPPIPIVSYLVGNKKDLPRTVPKADAEQVARDMGAAYYETSALSGESVLDIFEEMIPVVHSNVTTAIAQLEESQRLAAKKAHDRAKDPHKPKPMKGKGSGCLLL